MKDAKSGEFNPYLVLTRVALNNCKQALKLGELEISNNWREKAKLYLDKAKIWDMTREISEAGGWND